MKISGFTIVKNAVKFHYPIVESIQSILPICDEYIVAVGKSEDNTLDLIKSINSPKIKIIETEWDLSNGYSELTRQTNIALKACSGDWAFYLQSDEVIHEADLGKLKFLMQLYLNKPEVDALRFRWLHFYGSHYRYRIDQGWYQKQERIIRNNGTIESYHDGFGFHRIDGKKLQIADSFTYLYHYGWTYTPKQMTERKFNQSVIWNKAFDHANMYDYGNLNLFPVYWGSHPKVMTNIIAHNPLTQEDKQLIARKHWWNPFYLLKVRLKTGRRMRMRIDPLAVYPPKRVLVIRVGNIGDVLMATPVVRKLKNILPGCCIDFLVSPHAKAAVTPNTYINNVYVYEKSKRLAGKLKKFFLQQTLRHNHYDYCVVLETHEQYHQFAQRISPQAIKLGLRSKGTPAPLLNLSVELTQDTHGISHAFSLLEKQFQTTIDADDYHIDYFVSDATKAQASRLLGEWGADKGKYIILHPGSSVPHVPYRGWVAAHFTQLAQWLNSHGYRVFITGTHKEEPLITRVLDGVDHQLTKPFMGHSFDEYALLMQHASALVCADTGALHLGRAMNTPVVGLFGPTHMKHTGFIGTGPYKAIRNDFPCGPCIDNVPKDKQECLNGQPPACMQSITVEQVIEALHALIGIK